MSSHHSFTAANVRCILIQLINYNRTRKIILLIILLIYESAFCLKNIMILVVVVIVIVVVEYSTVNDLSVGFDYNTIR